MSKLFSALALFVGAVLVINYPAVKHIPNIFFFHLFCIILLFYILRLRVSFFSTFVGMALFAFYPGHFFNWAAGQFNIGTWITYFFCFFGAILVAFCFDRFDRFLINQERMVRVLFYIGCGALILGFVLLTVQINGAWTNEERLWQWRVEHVPSSGSYNGLADVLRKQSPLDVDEIKNLYFKAITLSPKDIAVHKHFAEFYHSLSEDEQAIDSYKKILIFDPRQEDVYFQLAMLYKEQKKHKAVIEIYNALLKVFPEDESIYIRLMDAYSQTIKDYPNELIYQEKREDLLAVYEQLSKRKKYTANDYYNLGFLYEQVGGFEQANRFYRKAIELQPMHEKALYGLAKRLQESGDVKSALLLYERLIKFYPKTTLAYLNMGIIYNALGDADKARYLYLKAIRLDINNADVYFNLGYLNESAGELREALLNYEKAVESNPQHAEAYYNMGNVYATLGQYPEAIASYLKTVGINQDHQNAFVNLSILSFKVRDVQGAIHFLESAQLLGYNPPDDYLKMLEPYRKK